LATRWEARAPRGGFRSRLMNLSECLEALGLRRGASADEARAAYLALARQHHPDRQTGEHSTFLRIRLAYETLKCGAEPAASIDSYEVRHGHQAVRSVAISTDTTLAVSASDDGSVRLWRLAHSSIVFERWLQGSGSKEVTGLCILEPRRVLMAAGDGRVTLADVDDVPGREPHQVFETRTRLLCVAASPSGRAWAAAGSALVVWVATHAFAQRRTAPELAASCSGWTQVFHGPVHGASDPIESLSFTGSALACCSGATWLVWAFDGRAEQRAAVRLEQRGDSDEALDRSGDSDSDSDSDSEPASGDSESQGLFSEPLFKQAGRSGQLWSVALDVRMRFVAVCGSEKGVSVFALSARVGRRAIASCRRRARNRRPLANPRLEPSVALAWWQLAAV
jgi:hypothetical protein